MKPYAPIEKYMAAIGLGLCLVGGYNMAHPVEMIMVHPSSSAKGAPHRPVSPEFVSKKGSQIYGGMVVALGAGICWMALYRGGK